MAYFTYTEDPIGYFIEKDVGNSFEYSVNNELDAYSLSLAEKFPHKVWVGGKDVAGMSGWRYAKVKKTVAYIVVDEFEGGAVVERWFLKKNTSYDAN
tara:strand:+ start:176 stop:466 length:291 start_codon:yes stop_codon:yes gene_type:complete